ncbi:hypothetical protein WH47_06296 [Habropoda laboriosa]|uniref:Uncharacterized protein n=1 Tax=Habropoda laboriosa TaxID=597456 RepID=A0A0L7QTB6_9HYME|nr:hypothetical protein WH47_06296 [Habropoda laboriosa]
MQNDEVNSSKNKNIENIKTIKVKGLTLKCTQKANAQISGITKSRNSAKKIITTPNLLNKQNPPRTIAEMSPTKIAEKQQQNRINKPIKRRKRAEQDGDRTDHQHEQARGKTRGPNGHPSRNI